MAFLITAWSVVGAASAVALAAWFVETLRRRREARKHKDVMRGAWARFRAESQRDYQEFADRWRREDARETKPERREFVN